MAGVQISYATEADVEVGLFRLDKRPGFAVFSFKNIPSKY
jgi:hypothetical protein